MFKIMVFEDNVDLNDNITDRLEKDGGYSVKSFYKFTEATKSIEGGYIPDLAILDIDNIEYINGERVRINDAGIRVAKKLKLIDTSLPIIFFSSYGHIESIRKKAIIYSPSGVLDKGDDDEEIGSLFKEVNKLFKERRSLLSLEKYFQKSFNNHISISQRDPEINNGDTTYYVLSPSAIDTVTYHKENQKAAIELLTADQFKKIVIKELKVRSKEEVKTEESLILVKIHQDIKYRYIKDWTEPLLSEPEVRNAFNTPKRELTEEKKALIKTAIHNGKIELQKLIDLNPPYADEKWEEVDQATAFSFSEIESTNPYLCIENNSWTYYERTTLREFTTITVNKELYPDTPDLIQRNTALKFFKQQLEVAMRSPDENSLIYIDATDANQSSMFINLSQVASFTEKTVKLKKREGLLNISSNTYNSLQEAFPCILTRPNN